MNDADIRFYLSLLWRRAPWLILVATSVAAVGIAVAFLLPPVYRAGTKILVEAPQIPSDLARSTVPADPWQQVQIIQQKLTTRENLLDFARRLHIYGGKAAGLSDDEIVDDMRARTTIEQIEATGPEQGGASIFSVAFDARRPELAARVANEFADVILDKNVSLRTDRASDTMQFFTREVARLGDELTSIEAGILKFKNANENALPDSIDFRRTQQSNQQERLLLLEREETALRTRRMNLLRAFEATGRVASSGPLSPDQQTLEDLNRTLSSQLVLFSQNSPNIVALRARIDALKNSIKERQGQEGPDSAGPSEMDIQMSEIDDRLKAIADERKAVTANLAELEKSIAATPANETALSAMERNRQNIQAQYNIAVAKLAEASTGKQIEANAKGSRLSVVEAASPPDKPIRPHRLRIAALSLLAGIGAAAGLFVLLEMLNSSIRRPKDLTDLLDAQPLATIPYIHANADMRWWRPGTAVGSLAMASLVLLVAADRVMPLGTLLGRVAGMFGYNPTM